MCDGYTVYQGRAKSSPKYFSDLGYPISGFCNPADKFMAVLSINYPKRKEDNDKIEYLRQCYEERQVGKVNTQMKEYTVSADGLAEKEIVKAPLKTQIKWLFWRTKLFAKRDRTVVKAKFGMTIFISALILFVFW